MLPTQEQDEVPRIKKKSTKEQDVVRSIKKNDEMSLIEKEDEICSTKERNKTSGDNIHRYNTRAYHCWEKNTSPSIGSRIQTQTTRKRRTRQVESHKLEEPVPRKTLAGKVPKTADEIERGRRAAERAHKKQIMDSAIEKLTAEYMEKSGGDLEKAAGFWFEREELKRRQPWPRLREAQTALEEMKKDALDPRELDEEIEREQEEMEKRRKRKRKRKRKARKENKACQSMQQSLRQFPRGIDLVSPKIALAMPIQFSESYIRQTRHREPSNLVQRHHDSTLSEERTLSIPLDRNTFHRAPADQALDGEPASSTIMLPKYKSLRNPAETLVGTSSTLAVSEIELEFSTTLRDTEMPSMQKLSEPPPQPGEQGSVSTALNRRRRRKADEDLELGEQWAASFSDDGHRPCVRRRQEKGPEN
ncbi:hypothetical protein F5Y09DRAFT_299415 [Xylaria sp. FL1042]|nr:hypothetical protein F5Y09DRAFT_299415 [Xylaria sp. FL1042]